MPTARRPRRASLQFYPRKRARKILPSANWKPLSSAYSKNNSVLGFIGYKTGMGTAIVRDIGDKSMTKEKNISLPVTILEVPNMKIFSVRFYKNGNVVKEVIVSDDKELKRKLKLPKQLKKLEENTPNEYDDIRVIAYSLVKKTGIKKTPDMIELAIGAENKIELVNELIGKEISISDFLKQELVDVRGVTTGKGFQGPVKRFGIKLRFHKSEKGVRRAGSIGPWHPARVTFRTPLPGQLGFFNRIIYNLKAISHGKISEKDVNPEEGFKNYGKIRTSYVILKGSVQGPAKRQILLTPSFRPSKLQSKKKFEFVELVR